MAVKIRLKRMGKIRAPHYRIVVVDSRKKRDGAVIEEIGKYHPTDEPSFIEVQSERAQYWLGVGAQPSEQVRAILGVTGDWAKFKGEGDAEGSLKSKDEKKSAEELIAEADKAAADSRDEAKKAKEKAESEKSEESTDSEGETAEAAEAPEAEADAAESSDES